MPNSPRRLPLLDRAVRRGQHEHQGVFGGGFGGAVGGKGHGQGAPGGRRHVHNVHAGAVPGDDLQPGGAVHLGGPHPQTGAQDDALHGGQQVP